MLRVDPVGPMLCAVALIIIATTTASDVMPHADAIVPEHSIHNEEMDGIDSLTRQFEAQISKDLSPPSGAPFEEQKLRAQEAKYQAQQAKLTADHDKAAAAEAVVEHEKNKLKKAQAQLHTARGGSAPALPADHLTPPAATPEVKASKPKVKMTEAEEAGSTSSCKAGCATKTMEDTQACDAACLHADTECREKCNAALDKCNCECSAHHTWICDGDDNKCHCWGLQAEKKGPIETAMLKAENEALAEGLTPEEAKERAVEAEKEAAGEEVDAKLKGAQEEEFGDWMDAAL